MKISASDQPKKEQEQTRSKETFEMDSVEIVDHLLRKRGIGKGSADGIIRVNGTRKFAAGLGKEIEGALGLEKGKTIEIGVSNFDRKNEPNHSYHLGDLINDLAAWATDKLQAGGAQVRLAAKHSGHEGPNFVITGRR